MDWESLPGWRVHYVFRQQVLNIIQGAYQSQQPPKHEYSDYEGFDLRFKPGMIHAWINVYGRDPDTGKSYHVFTVGTNSRIVQWKQENQARFLPAIVTSTQLLQVKMFVHNREQWRQQYGQGIAGPLVLEPKPTQEERWQAMRERYSFGSVYDEDDEYAVYAYEDDILASEHREDSGESSEGDEDGQGGEEEEGEGDGEEEEQEEDKSEEEELEEEDGDDQGEGNDHMGEKRLANDDGAQAAGARDEDDFSSDERPRKKLHTQ